MLLQVIRNVWLFIFTLFVGACGGWLCGTIILTFGGYIGRSGSTGLEYVGYWNPGYASWVASWTGLPIGAIFFCIAYCVMLRNVNWLKILLITGCATVFSGCIGAFVSPILAVWTGCVGFYTSCLYLARNHSGS